MERKRTYETKQKRLVREFLSAANERYVSVDDVYVSLKGAGQEVGRTTVYRSLEALAAEGRAMKVFGPGGGEARYRSALAHAADHGQLLCLQCGSALALDCSMLDDFAQHVQDSHGFAIDHAQTVLYGVCAACRSDAGQTHQGGCC
ncbi:transcriptional repressor [Eggerthellaceae bacterium zg-1084]|uniref:Transcriptional repressor n=1 Tax=Berryella wangjianweii TaxID=2734634 RepID=A0A6M8J312_9ACTN|nr:transcriptional repressor [Berryella wangjianweii]NPD31022.1 transcriptional repressor [Berryella wangjianweii]NPD31884.1 transcriptional repressor [Eggerthellaceae bacterium zg-997]QKF07521.1 transcriptional repressor [Berryella wangjianweii]